MKSLVDLKHEFISHWGEMGAKWGISRDVAELHAFLYLSREALNVAEIAQSFGKSETELQPGLDELSRWGLAQVVSDGGTQRYKAEQDVLTMLKLIAEERRKRELDPTLEVLKSFVERIPNLEPSKERDDVEKGVKDLYEFLLSVSSLYDRGRKLPLPLVKKLLKLDKHLERLLGFL